MRLHSFRAWSAVITLFVSATGAVPRPDLSSIDVPSFPSSSPDTVPPPPDVVGNLTYGSVLNTRDNSPDFIRGVNIGGLLVLEKWMTPEVFQGTNAIDQYTFDSTPGAVRKLYNHYNSYFTEADMQALRATGINSVRIPIGFWAYDNGGTPYLKGADAYLERIVRWAQKYGIRVWIDLHGAPGSQNGFDNSGRAGAVEWQQGNNLGRTISVLQVMARKYGAQRFANTVVGLQLVNEPISWDNNRFDVTKQWTVDAYNMVRAQAENKNLMLIMHDAFEGPNKWTDLPARLNSNGLFGIDSHLYQVFIPEDNKLTQQQHIQKACGWSSDLRRANAILPTFVGEWSPVTNTCVNPDGSTSAGTSCSVPGCQCQIEDITSWKPQTVEQARRYVEAQLDTFESSTRGYFMWSFKAPGSWGFMNGIQKGVIPNPVTDRKYPGQCS
ncbi:MAG: exo-1,3-beta-glucanase [Caeruleum heppii]|nr:MAG: exo-1,3-beta-glucanase [Caeruleum heppii]